MGRTVGAPAMSRSRSASRVAALGVAGNEQHGVVAGDGAEDVGRARRGRSPRRADERRRAGCGRRPGWRWPRRRRRSSAASRDTRPSAGVGERTEHRPGRLVADGVDHADARAPNLDRAHLLEVARQRRLGHLDALGREQRDQLGLRVDVAGGEQRRDPRLPRGLACAAPPRRAGRRRRHQPARHLRRVEQERQQRLLRVQPVLGLVEHDARRPVDHRGGDLLAAMGRQAVHDDRRRRQPAARRSRSSIAYGRNDSSRPAASPSCPIEAQTSV